MTKCEVMLGRGELSGVAGCRTQNGALGTHQTTNTLTLSFPSMMRMMMGLVVVVTLVLMMPLQQLFRYYALQSA